MVGTMAKIDDSVKKKVPELRFKGFTDDWEERKLGDIAPLRGGFAYYDEQDKDDKYILPDKSAVLAMSGATTGKE